MNIYIYTYIYICKDTHILLVSTVEKAQLGQSTAQPISHTFPGTVAGMARRATGSGAPEGVCRVESHTILTLSIVHSYNFYWLCGSAPPHSSPPTTF